MEENSFIFDFLINSFGVKNIFWSFYIINYIFAAIAYKLGFARTLPIFKSIFVYVLLLIGVYIITIFSVLQFPMTESLIIISLVLGIYRFRLHQRRKSN